MYISVVVDNDMYVEVAERDLDQTWKENNIVDFWKFSYLLYNQMIKCNPTHHKYSGNTNMRPDTKHNITAI